MSNSIKMGLRRNPYAFTELGVAMLSSILNTKFADYNDINEDTRTQLELINLSLAELQAKRTENQSRPRIGYVK